MCQVFYNIHQEPYQFPKHVSISRIYYSLFQKLVVRVKKLQLLYNIRLFVSIQIGS